MYVTCHNGVEEEIDLVSDPANEVFSERMPTIRYKVVFADWEKMTRWVRAEVMSGQTILFSQPDQYYVVGEFHFQANETDPKSLVETLYRFWNLESRGHERSMSTGDLIIIEDSDIYLCQSAGWKKFATWEPFVKHLVKR